MSEQPSAHTSQTGLQELNNLGYSSALTTNKHLQLNLSFTKLITLSLYRLYSTHGILLLQHPVVAFCISERRSQVNNFRDIRPNNKFLVFIVTVKFQFILPNCKTKTLAELPDTSCGCFETLQRKKKARLSLGYENLSDPLDRGDIILEALTCCVFPFARQR